MSRLDIEEYRAHLKIDRGRLDDMLVEQPVLFHDVSDAYALAVSQRDMAREDQKRVSARAVGAVREALSVEGIKPTVSLTDERLEQNESHIEARDRYKSAAMRADRLLALKEAFQQRSYMLKDLAGLYTASYYQTPHAVDRNTATRPTYKHPAKSTREQL